MIKNFENYRKVQGLAGNMTQWEKNYNDGATAKCVVSNVGITRKMVIAAFALQEAGFSVGCFKNSDEDRCAEQCEY